MNVASTPLDEYLKFGSELFKGAYSFTNLMKASVCDLH